MPFPPSPPYFRRGHPSLLPNDPDWQDGVYTIYSPKAAAVVCMVRALQWLTAIPALVLPLPFIAVTSVCAVLCISTKNQLAQQHASRSSLSRYLSSCIQCKRAALLRRSLVASFGRSERCGACLQKVYVQLPDLTTLYNWGHGVSW